MHEVFFCLLLLLRAAAAAAKVKPSTDDGELLEGREQWSWRHGSGWCPGKEEERGGRRWPSWENSGGRYLLVGERKKKKLAHIIHVLVFMYSTVPCRLEPEAAERGNRLHFHADADVYPSMRRLVGLVVAAEVREDDAYRPTSPHSLPSPKICSLSDCVKSINIGIGTSHVYRNSSCPYTFVCWRFPHFRRWRKCEAFFSSWGFSLQNTFQFPNLVLALTPKTPHLRCLLSPSA